MRVFLEELLSAAKMARSITADPSHVRQVDRDHVIDRLDTAIANAIAVLEVDDRRIEPKGEKG